MALVLVVLTANAQNANWETVSIPEYCTFQIPRTMELQSGTYKRINDEYRKNVLEVTTGQSRVVAQPAGINSFDSEALTRYCRVIVETSLGQAGDYLMLGDPLTFTAAELSELDDRIRQQAQEAERLAAQTGRQMRILCWGGTRVVKIGSVQAIETTYSRSGNSGAVLVRQYEVHNNDAKHILTLSYRESEADAWARDMTTVLASFRFSRR